MNDFTKISTESSDLDHKFVFCAPKTMSDVNSNAQILFFWNFTSVIRIFRKTKNFESFYYLWRPHNICGGPLKFGWKFFLVFKWPKEGIPIGFRSVPSIFFNFFFEDAKVKLFTEILIYSINARNLPPPLEHENINLLK